jgi:hypothetical protein
MNHDQFWTFFNEFAGPQLAHRHESFKFVFQHLTNLNRPVCIVETGCVRNEGTYAGEGQSTVLFDKFSECVPGTMINTVDISSESTDMCKRLVSQRVKVHTMDSVSFLKNDCKNQMAPFHTIDLLYLDSYDVDFNDPHDSAMHHMKELLAASSMINASTLILVDDSPSMASFYIESGQIKFASTPKVGGKGMYIGSYMADIGKKPIIQSYQTAWLGL